MSQKVVEGKVQGWQTGMFCMLLCVSAKLSRNPKRLGARERKDFERSELKRERTNGKCQTFESVFKCIMGQCSKLCWEELS